MTITAVRIHPDDNVANLLRDHAKGERPQTAEGPLKPLATAVPMGHKVAVSAVGKGEPVVKFGAVIGRATCAIAPGDHVHLHNLEGEPP